MSDDTTGRTTDGFDGFGTAENAGGCLFSGLGALAGLVVWVPRAAFSIDGGFEAHARDLSVVYLDLPLILLGGTLMPAVVWLLTLRRSRRLWLAALVTSAALALGVWALTEWWMPRQHPDPGYGPGI
ncbi:hypothetical protein [Streptomyces sp. NPDC005805]|uniref:hypothetical protein n=1 Tax=Streptomyces sp. NPDC005805 TaxID=3157068 RepID=UPI0033E12EB8